MNDQVKTPVISEKQLLKGRGSGVQVIQQQSQPGATFSIRIHGTNSINSRSDSLYVINGYADWGGNINPGDANKFEGINAIRTRAGLGTKLLDFGNTPISADFIDSLAKERLRELPIEGVKRHDLIRWGKMIEVKAS